MFDRPTVLLSDRNQSFLMYLSILLTRMDYDVLPVGDCKSLLKMAGAVQPDLIALGPDVPESTTLETLALLRADAALSHLPLLVVDEAGREAVYLAAGCQAFLAKPVDIDQLHAALTRIGSLPGGRRKHLRTEFRQQVILTHNEKVVKCQGITLSEGGIFIRRPTPFPPGCHLRIEIPALDQRPLVLAGEVIYTKQLTQDRFTMPPGMAVRFLPGAEQDHLALKLLVRRLLVGDLLEEQEESILSAINFNYA